MGEQQPATAGGNGGLHGIEFPVLCFNQDIVLVEETYKDVTTASSAGLKGGWYDGLLIVGANSVAIKVKGARKLHGVGRFRGYDIFLSQRIRVELDFAGPSFEASLDEVKHRVLRSFSDWHGWSTSGDFLELRAGIEDARSITEVIRLLESRDAAAEAESLKDAEKAYAVVLVDRSQDDDDARFTVREVVWTSEEAEAEVKRLKQANRDKDWFYLLQPTRVKRRR